MTTRSRTLLAGGFALAAAAAARATPEADPWQTWKALRADLVAAGDVAAPFTQSYVPAGFTEGDSERGTVTVGLPHCLRWDYSEPYPKSYLLCDSRLHAWTKGEPQGQRMAVDPEEQAGLDLLLLPAEELARRYSARLGTAASGRVAVTLTPVKPEAALADAAFELDPKSRRPTALSYRDREGNATRFEFGAFAPVRDPAIFAPPAGVEWKEP